MIGRNSVFIIAEAGVNHNGSLDLAMKLVDIAKKSGADAIKFQTWKTENVITKNAKKPYYQEFYNAEESQFQMLKKLELSYRDFVEIKQCCDNAGIIFLSTADEFESAFFLKDMVPIIKIASSELTDLPFLKKIAKFRKPILLSTGMGTLEEIDRALSVITDEGFNKKDITILHANTAYPTPYKDANLRAITTIREKFDVKVGYSDHTLGFEAAIAAVALGAVVIEKHFTLDKNMIGPDHSSSLDPKELSAMVNAVRNIEAALGDGIKCTSESERKNILFVRKSIVAKKHIKKGDVFSEKNITIKRPGNGLSPEYWDKIMGKTASKDFDEDELIEL